MPSPRGKPVCAARRGRASDRYRGCVCLGIALLVSCSDLGAAEFERPINQFSHASWQTENGLPQNSVQAIVQTREGYLWLGTQEGLVRFDGARFSVYDRAHTPEIRVNHVQALYEARDGTLWVGLYGGGLSSLKARQFRLYSIRG